MLLDARLLPYTKNNAPLPEFLWPALNDYLSYIQTFDDATKRRLITLHDHLKRTHGTYLALREEVAALTRVALSMEAQQLEVSLRQTTIDPSPERRLRHLKDIIADKQATADSQLKRGLPLIRAFYTISDQRRQLNITESWFASLKGLLRWFPPELIALILEYVVYEDTFGYLDWKERILFRRLRQVSRLWRATAFSTPSLWRGVQLDRRVDPDDDGTDSSSKGDQDYPRMLTSWFSRAGQGTPLRLVVTHLPSFRISQVFQFMSSSGLNITFLHFHWSVRDVCSQMDMLVNQRQVYRTVTDIGFPILANDDDGQEATQAFKQLDLTDMLPNLQKLSFRGHYTRCDATFSIHFSHSTVTRLSLMQVVYALPQRHFAAMIEGLPSLCELVVVCCTCNYPFVDEGQAVTVVHTSLRTITFSDAVPAEWFGALTSPFLDTLHIRPLEYRTVNCDEDTLPILGAFVTRSRPPHLKLVFDKGRYSSRLIPKLLSVVDCSIETLDVPSFAALEETPNSDSDSETSALGLVVPRFVCRIVSREDGDVEVLDHWMEKLADHIEPGQVVELAAPSCSSETRLVSRQQ